MGAQRTHRFPGPANDLRNERDCENERNAHEVGDVGLEGPALVFDRRGERRDDRGRPAGDGRDDTRERHRGEAQRGGKSHEPERAQVRHDFSRHAITRRALPAARRKRWRVRSLCAPTLPSTIMRAEPGPEQP